MSFMHGEKLDLLLRPSRYLMGGLLLLHIAALMVVLALALQWWAIVSIAIILSVSLMVNIQKYVGFQFKNSIHQLSTLNGTQWTLTQKNQQVIEASIMGDSVVTSYLLILNFVAKNKKKYSVIILRDMVSAQEFRATHLLLRNRAKMT
jgi:hypothetical protein